MPSIESGFPVVSATLSSTPANLSITVPGGLTNSALLVFTFHERAGNVVSGVTANGTAMTNVATEDPTTWSKVTCWKLAAPAAGTYNVAVSRSSGGTDPMRIVAYLLTSADQTNIVRAPAQSSSDSATSASNTVGSVAASDLLIDQLSVDGTGHSPTPGADQTATYATVNLGGGINEGRGSQQAGSAGGVMSWTWTTAAPYSHVAVAVIHDAGGTSVQASRGLSYDVANTVQAARGLSYDVQGQVQASRALSYDVANSVVASRALSYDLIAFLLASRALSYDVLAAVLASRGLSYDVLTAGQVQAARNLSYDVLAAVLASRGLSYDVLNAVLASRALSYDVLNTLQAPCGLVYDLGDVVIPAGATRQGLWFW